MTAAAIEVDTLAQRTWYVLYMMIIIKRVPLNSLQDKVFSHYMMREFCFIISNEELQIFSKLYLQSSLTIRYIFNDIYPISEIKYFYHRTLFAITIKTNHV